MRIHFAQQLLRVASSLARRLASSTPTSPEVVIIKSGSFGHPTVDCRVTETPRYVLREIAEDLKYKTDGKIYRFDPSVVEWVFVKEFTKTE